MGAKVIGISQSESKREIAKELGCDDYINASDEDSLAKHNSSMTHIVCTGASPDFQCKYC
jgi:D-arabinose 1-dehydrogenase-like Zn-dependent alcohol dehydrogenase